MARLMSAKDWKNSTSAFGRARSKELKAIDEALERYETYGGGDAQWRLQQAINDWKAKEGPGDAWKKSVRNKNQAVEKLIALMNGGDSEAAWGRVPPFMHESFNNARLGVLYLLGHLDVKADFFNVVLEGGLACVGPVLSYQGGKLDDGGLAKASVDTAQNFYNTAIVPANVILTQAGSALVDPELDKIKNVSAEERQAIGQRTRALFTGLVSKTIELVKEKFSGVQPLAASSKALVNLCCKLFLSTVGAGLVSGGLDTFKGLVQLNDASISRVRMYIKGRGVSISAGHPSAVIEGIKWAMNENVLKGLWTTLKGAGNIGLAFATWGAALIAGVVTALVEMVVKLIWRLAEMLHMKKIFSQAASYWSKKTSTSGLHMTPFAFNEWFRNAIRLHPSLAILTLNSGICGDKMVWLSMFSGNDFTRTITSEEFLRGAKYLDSLKPWGAQYLANVGYAFRAKSPQSSAILTFALGHKANLSLGGKAWAMFVDVASA